MLQRQRSLRQRGQALTEFIIVATMLLVPLYLLIPVLGKYLDMKASAVVGARYVAWERTIYFGGSTASETWPGNDKSDTAIHNDMRQRVFAQGTGIAAADSTASNWGSKGYKNGWKNRNGTGMLPNYSSVSQTLAQEKTPGLANEVIRVLVKVANALGPFELEMKGLHVAEVGVTANTQAIAFSWDNNAAKSFKPGPLTFSDKNAILVNTWSAKGRDHVKSQTQGLTPTGVFQTTAGQVILTALKVVIGIAMPEIWFLELGKIEPDIVPEDRLVGTP